MNKNKKTSSKCLTPGSIFHIDIQPSSVSIKVDLPMKLRLSKKEAEDLDNRMHDAMEEVLSQYFIQK